MPYLLHFPEEFSIYFHGPYVRAVYTLRFFHCIVSYADNRLSYAEFIDDVSVSRGTYMKFNEGKFFFDGVSIALFLSQISIVLTWSDGILYQNHMVKSKQLTPSNCKCLHLNRTEMPGIET